MKKLCFALFICSAILLMVNLSLAQSPRTTNVIQSEGKTTFTNISVTGLGVDGVPGYIEFLTPNNQRAYLYVDDGFELVIASDTQVSTTGASPKTTDWGNAGTVAGDQTRW